jgi:Uma2 family endonuclease
MLRRAEPEHSDASSPRLDTGDHLDQPTFHGLYRTMPEHFRAELIEGVVIVPSPTRHDHSSIGSLLNGWLVVYRLATPGVDSLDNGTVLLPPNGEPQPDSALIIEPTWGGQTRLEDGYVSGAPELALEVAYSSVSYDLHSKYRMYERDGVQEYVVAVIADEEIRWFVCENGRFVPMSPGEDGVFRSRIFPGLWLNAAALWANHGTAFMETIQQGLRSPEHAAFIEKLVRSKRG